MSNMTQRYIVLHKPDDKSPMEYIGPFVSERLAEEFADDNYPPEKWMVRPVKSREQVQRSTP